MVMKAVIFDFIGTLADVKNYSVQESKMKLFRAVVDVGFRVQKRAFTEAYSRSHEKFRIIRYQELVEVTNAFWISDALNALGFKTRPDDTRIRTAVNVFFEDYARSLELTPCAKKVLSEMSNDYKLGLISNFTYSPVIHSGLRKLAINHFFNAVLVSQDVGWRKPSRLIFGEALRRLGVTAEETVYVGDSPLEDLRGAGAVGMKTVFVPSQFYSKRDLQESRQKPNLTVSSLCDLHQRFSKFLNEIQN